jgi:predicted Rossmann-fold nucleotide-binding protein
MEAGNLGAWLAGTPGEEQISHACAVLGAVPGYSPDTRQAFIDKAEQVRAAWPNGAVNLGVATWVYRDEPISRFATHIATYFNNNVRENGLLSIATSGVVYAPGGAGTAQEIFTDAAQNSYSPFNRVSPMVFLSRSSYLVAQAALTAALRAEAVGMTQPWDDRIHVTDDPTEAIAFIVENDPVAVTGVTPEPGDRARVRVRR